jgi:hypothetical protein
MMPATAVAGESKTPHSMKRWPHDLVLGFLPLLLGLEVLVAIIYLPLALRGVADFRQLYTGGYMIRTGHASELYDYDTQQRFEEKLVPVNATFLLPINHPAFEELLFVPLSLFSYRTGYWIFLAVNIALLVICVRLLKPRLKALTDRWQWFPALLVAGFFPIFRTLTQGQDSIVMLTLLVAALLSLDRGREMTAGLLVGSGIFKFQIAIPIALLFLVWRRWRFSLAFGISSLLALLVSMWIVGIEGARLYGQTLLSMSVHLNSKADMLRYATIPNEMANLRGLISAIRVERLPQMWIQALVLIASAAVLFVAARQRPSLPFAITASALVSYHLIAHDASVLLIPVMVALCAGSVRTRALAAVLLIAPVCAIFPQYAYLAAIPLLMFFLGALGQMPEYIKPVDLQAGVAGVYTHACNRI